MVAQLARGRAGVGSRAWLPRPSVLRAHLLPAVPVLTLSARLCRPPFLSPPLTGLQLRPRTPTRGNCRAEGGARPNNYGAPGRCNRRDAPHPWRPPGLPLGSGGSKERPQGLERGVPGRTAAAAPPPRRWPEAPPLRCPSPRGRSQTPRPGAGAHDPSPGETHRRHLMLLWVPLPGGVWAVLALPSLLIFSTPSQEL